MEVHYQAHIGEGITWHWEEKHVEVIEKKHSLDLLSCHFS